MKNPNPFVPSVSLIVVPKRSGRERFRLGFLAVLSVHAAVFSALLIQGCKSDLMTKTAGHGYPAGLAEGDSRGMLEVRAREVRPVTQVAVQRATVVPMISTPPMAPPVEVTAVAPREVVHTVKSGDTLLGIARVYGASVKSIRSANKLPNDRLIVGTKLKVLRGA